MRDWRSSTWGNEISLEYGKAIRGYSDVGGQYRVFGSNGPIGWTSDKLASGPGVILGRKGAYRGVQFSREPFFVIDTAYYVVPKTKIDMRWLYYAIIHHKLGEIDDGSPIPSTTRAAVYVRQLDVPCFYEQQGIASILGALDDKIDFNRRMNETLEAMARAIFKDWFVDFGPTRAKMDGRRPYLAPEIWTLFPDRLDVEDKPTGWERLSLREAAEVLSGGTPDKSEPEYWGGSIPWISPKAMNEMHVSNSDEMVTPLAIGNGTRTASSGSVLLMVRGMGLHQGVRISQARRDVSFNQDVKALIPRRLAPAHLLFGMLDAAPFLFAKVEASGHGTGKLPTDMIETLDFVLPKGPAYRELVRPLDAVNEKIALNNQESVTLAETRDLLLPKLMSGEIRVRDAERIVGMAV